MAASTVTLDRAYFETLLRKAQFDTSGVNYGTPIKIATVTISKSDHDNLLRSRREYVNLRRNLFKGGASQETLDLLIADDEADQALDGTLTWATEAASETDAYQTQIAPSYARERTAHGQVSQGANQSYIYRIPDSGTNGFETGTDFEGHYHGADLPAETLSYNGTSQAGGRRAQFAKHAKRTIHLLNLPEGITYQDLTDNIRGGMLLEVLIRSDRVAAVSFLEEDAATAYFQHVKRNDLYIKAKRVNIRWGDRQFILPGHVSNKISIGATRSLIIRNCNPKHTEDAIRQDLDHIHNLVVISITFEGGNAHISTNSVHNAMFARTCMMSRSTYKGSKIEWDVDECAAPLQSVRKESLPEKKKKAGPPINRFALLDVDEAGESDVETERETEMGVRLSTTTYSPKSTRVAA